jgi:hypothetical protein
MVIIYTPKGFVAGLIYSEGNRLIHFTGNPRQAKLFAYEYEAVIYCQNNALTQYAIFQPMTSKGLQGE